PLSVTLFCSILVVANGVKDYGVSGWNCDEEVMKRSASVPQSVHSLRFADINVIGAIGDSITTGYGAEAEQIDRSALKMEHRGCGRRHGPGTARHEPVPVSDILKKFNPNLFGFSIFAGAAHVWESSQLNAAVPGAEAVNLTDQAIDLVRRFRNHPDKVDIANDWKLIHIFVGGNDICHYCEHPEEHAPHLFGKRIGEAIQILKDNLPRTIVVITGMLDISVLRDMAEKNANCAVMHRIACSCIHSNYTTEQLRGVCKEYMREEHDLQSSGRFDTSDDFSVVIQPFLEDFNHAPLRPDGLPDISLFAPDCFHFSAFGHAVVGKNLWNNILQPVGEKERNVTLTDLSTPLYCPPKSCPFIRTTKNSADCGKYWTPAA
ncbi:hypothetical protein PMAYCL1PPCAC_31436, partial [Pristionchus mayeri]